MRFGRLPMSPVEYYAHHSTMLQFRLYNYNNDNVSNNLVGNLIFPSITSVIFTYVIHITFTSCFVLLRYGDKLFILYYY